MDNEEPLENFEGRVSDEAAQVGSIKYKTDTPEDDYVPEGFDSVEEFLSDMREAEWSAASTHDDRARKG